MNFEALSGQTPLDTDDAQGLLLTHILTRQELDRWELDNINQARKWVAKKKPKNILTDSFLKQLHKKMFEDVWRWAGHFRKSDKNIGCEWYNVPVELTQLCDNMAFWIENKTFDNDEIAVRFHHKLVTIHLFPNGNGRHARLATDILLKYTLLDDVFSWGSANLVLASKGRMTYIESLIAADNEDYSGILDFVRT